MADPTPSPARGSADAAVLPARPELSAFGRSKFAFDGGTAGALGGDTVLPGTVSVATVAVARRGGW
jgi:hypothetical protein